MVDLSDTEGGEHVIVDARVFHRSGVDGTHHIEEGIEMFVEPKDHNPYEGDRERTLLLMESEKARLYDSYVSLVDMLVVPASDPTAHPVVADIRRPVNALKDEYDPDADYEYRRKAPDEDWEGES